MKYMGSKSRISKYIVPIIQKYIDDNNVHHYLEPFCGGCNVIDKIKCNRKFAYDIDKYLVNLLLHVREGGLLPEVITKELYDELRKAWYSNNSEHIYSNWLIGCACYLASYNGRGFDGGYAKPGYEKTKNGERYRNYYQESKKNLLDQFQQPLAQDIIFGINDYREIKCSGYVIYCDPPYQSTKQYANSKNFNYEEFWQIMREWSENNIVLISELQAPDDFECIWEQDVSRSIKAKDKSKATEKLFKWKG